MGVYLPLGKSHNYSHMFQPVPTSLSSSPQRGEEISFNPGHISESKISATDWSKMNPLQDLGEYLLPGVRMVDPHATRCLEGTRTKLLADITTNAGDPNGRNVIWILGAPGSGKSSLSLSAKSMLQNQGLLVTYFRFDRNEATTTTPTALWRRVAYDIARRLPASQAQLLQKLRDDKVDLDSSTDVFSFLIEEPLSSLTNPVDHSLVVIIDALDECGGLAGPLSQDRRTLLRTLKRWTKLPKYFKLLVTSRPEGVIEQVLSPISTLIEIHSGTFLVDNPGSQETIEIDKDIQTFLESRFEEIRASSSSLPPDWPGQVMIIRMVHRAAGNFMWAVAATNFISSGIHLQERLDAVMRGLPEAAGMQPLYSLYSTILDLSFKNIGSAEAEVLRAVLGVIVLAQRPFEDIEFTKLPTPTPVSFSALEMIRAGLCSVVGKNQSLRFVHQSFYDFLISKECPPQYAVRKDDTQHLLTNLCLTTMTNELRFNMCGLETSYLKNVDVPDIGTKISKGIPPLLVYSCSFLADHLSQSSFNRHLMNRVKEVIMDKLLYWFEAMSLLEEMNRVSYSLLLITEWLHISLDDEFRVFVCDAYRFIGAFALPIAESAPHIYISALPFAPEYSLVAKRFLPRFPWTLALSTGKPTNWSSCLFTSERHDDVVRSIAFSPDEKYFVSGSLDKTIYVYDSKTGNVVWGPYSTNLMVSCVLFEPDGRRLRACYERGILVRWDIERHDKAYLFFTTPQDSEVEEIVMGLPILGFTTGCINGDQKIIYADKRGIALRNGEKNVVVCKMRYQERTYDKPRVSISPSGCYIACATSDDRIIRFWKVIGGTEIQGPTHSHPRFEHTNKVVALSFSVDGDFAVSGSSDGHVLIWDARTGDTIGPPLVTRAMALCAVAYSHNSHLLVTSSADTCAVMVWDALTHKAVLGPLEGHTLFIHTIILSRDGQKALTASTDYTVRMWDLGRKDVVPVTQVSERNKGHSFPLQYITFSPCGKRLVSIDSLTIRAWDVGHSGRPKHGTAFNYTRLIFSPDGNHIVAYNNNDNPERKIGHGIIGVWNAETVELVRELDLSDANYGRTYIMHASFRPSDDQLITCSSNGVVRTWNLRDDVSKIIANLPMILALSPDGMTVVVHDSNRNPCHYMWSTSAHQPLPLTFADDGLLSTARKVVYSPSGRFIATIHPTSTHENQLQDILRVWNAETRELVAHPSTTFETRIIVLAFSPDDHYIAISPSGSNDTSIFIYDVRTGRMSSGPWGGHSEPIGTLAFSTDGEKLASGSLDRQIRVWSMDDLLSDLQPSDHLLGVGWYMSEGWIKNSEGKLLFWVPKEHRPRLVWPCNVLFDGYGIATELDLSKFRYGGDWTECFAEGD